MCETTRLYVIKRGGFGGYGVGFIDVIKETDTTYLVRDADGRESRKQKRLCSTYPTFEAALNAYRERVEGSIKALEAKLEDARSKLAEIPSMQESSATRIPYYML